MYFSKFLNDTRKAVVYNINNICNHKDNNNKILQLQKFGTAASYISMKCIRGNFEDV